MSLTKPSVSPIPLALGDLGNGRKGITPAYGQTLAEAASVCLEEQGHVSPTEIQVSGHFESPGRLEWNIPSDQSRRCWNDDGYATEQGAYGIAALIVEHCGLEVVLRSKKKTGFDFWLGPPNQENTLFQDLAPSGSQNSDRAGLPEKPFSLASLRLCAFALKPGGGGQQMPHGFGKKDECGFLPKAAAPGWK